MFAFAYIVMDDPSWVEGRPKIHASTTLAILKLLKNPIGLIVMYLRMLLKFSALPAPLFAAVLEPFAQMR